MNSGSDLNFVHRFLPGNGDPSPPVLLLLHGTGGNEDDLLPLGEALLPGAPLLSPRGRILENGMPRFFRRLAEGVFDEEDLVFRARELADFLAAARHRYGFENRPVVAAGYSNGANIAAALLLLIPGAFQGAALFHAMTPLTPPVAPDLAGVPVFLAAGRSDPLVPAPLAERLAAQLSEAGAEVETLWNPGGHQLTGEEVRAAKAWLAERFSKRVRPSG